jgi:hypothetical protein
LASWEASYAVTMSTSAVKSAPNKPVERTLSFTRSQRSAGLVPPGDRVMSSIWGRAFLQFVVRGTPTRRVRRTSTLCTAQD